MNVPLQVTFRNLPASDSLVDHVRGRVAKLEIFCSRIVACRVAIEVPHHNHHHVHSGHYRVRIDLTVPGAELVIGSARTYCQQHVRAAVDEAFRDAERVVKDHVRQKRDGARSSDRAQFA